MTGNELDFNEKRRKKNMNKSNMDDSQDDFFEEPEVWINSFFHYGVKLSTLFQKLQMKKKNPRFCFNRTTTTVSDENSLKWNSGWLKHALAAAACPISLWFTLKEEHLCCTFPLYPTLALNQFWKVLLAIKEELIGNCFRDFMGK